MYGRGQGRRTHTLTRPCEHARAKKNNIDILGF